MSKFISFLSLSVALMFTQNSLNAVCHKCVKIESERAEEQAKNPQPPGYYDDEMHRQEEAKKNVADNMNTSTQTNLNQSARSAPEKTFTQQEQQNFQKLDQSHQTMIKQDKALYENGYDPNQNYFPDEAKQYKNQTDKNNPYSEQEKALRGNLNGITEL